MNYLLQAIGFLFVCYLAFVVAALLIVLFIKAAVTLLRQRFFFL